MGEISESDRIIELFPPLAFIHVALHTNGPVLITVEIRIGRDDIIFQGFWSRCRSGPRPALDLNADFYTDLGPLSGVNVNNNTSRGSRSTLNHKNAVSFFVLIRRSQSNIRRGRAREWVQKTGHVSATRERKGRRDCITCAWLDLRMIRKAGYGRRQMKVESLRWRCDRCVVGVECLKDRWRNSDVRERCGLKEDVVTGVERGVTSETLRNIISVGKENGLMEERVECCKGSGLMEGRVGHRNSPWTKYNSGSCYFASVFCEIFEKI
ncbi:hypothetical protein EVAR_41374_1 [Eumeta japonica]|uniref:Uncharacterized protein n=1 Tax=Eumeta variegata TaxID=151549 RepID=A0A4C1WXK1_EUMVA|nr:hypothetical protein EVAR_41374_1 [Eumeta japonica]